MRTTPPLVQSKLCFIGILTLLIFAVGEEFAIAEQPSVMAAPSWPRFLNTDFSGTAKMSVSVADGVANWPWGDPPQCRWSLSVGEGYGLGVIDRGAYFHFDAHEGKERLRRIDMRNGQVLWSQENELNYRDLYGYESGARCSPTIDGDQIFTLGVAGALTARDVETGTQQWRIETNQRYHVVQNFFGVGSAPLVNGDAVIVMIGGSPIADQAIAPGRLDRVSPNGLLLVAFHRDTGEELWRCGDDLASYSSPRTMQIGDRKCVLVFGREFLHVIDPVEGKSLGNVRYRADILESVNAMVPVVSGQRVLVSDCYDLGASLFEIELDRGEATFRSVWRDPEGRRRDQSLRSHMSTPVLQQGFLYACSGRNAPDSDFRCVDFATGKVQWTAMERRRSAATRLGEVLLVLKETGTLHVVRCTPVRFDEIAVWNLDEASGDGSADRPAIRYPCWAAPIIAGDSVLVRGDETVLCLKLPTS